eukprot:CAMPEP_0184646664 /NCGR_PEP_ID=MMETSP0308-20130426/3402_1 /TAXON_ID=38269 /ORGANISM="Gloeochaete witrockiana, Strain SAG 46.84" /LENGTH=127 /DNA_ID=CAMNT_0027076893 /DNA_START=223 /DNA_END=606 /DNA_ORIENTATION=-
MVSLVYKYNKAIIAKYGKVENQSGGLYGENGKRENNRANTGPGPKNESFLIQALDSDSDTKLQEALDDCYARADDRTFSRSVQVIQPRAARIIKELPCARAESARRPTPQKIQCVHRPPLSSKFRLV